MSLFLTAFIHFFLSSAWMNKFFLPEGPVIAVLAYFCMSNSY